MFKRVQVNLGEFRRIKERRVQGRLFIYVLGRGEGAVDFSRARGRVYPAQGNLSKSKF